MNQTLKNQIISRFSEDWANQPNVVETCQKIFDYLLSHPRNQLTHLTYNVLKKSTGIDSTIEILKATQYLCGERTPVLSLHFEFADENDDFHDLDDDEIRLAKKTGKLAHPITGTYIDDYEDKVLIYFTPSPLIEEVRGH